MKLKGTICGIALVCMTARAAVQANYDTGQRIWNLSNGSISATFQLTPEGYFLTRQITDMQTGDVWIDSPNRPSSPVRLQTETDLFDASTSFTLYAYYCETLAIGGTRLNIVLQDLKGRAQITVVLEMYNDQPVIRYSLKYKNLTSSTAYITWINMVPWTFSDAGKR